MAHNFMPSIEPWELPDLSYSTYGEESATSSPSPSMLFMNTVPPEDYRLNSTCPENPSNPQPKDAYTALNSIEFTDLTSPPHEDRRWRRSTGQDKEAISNMRIRRRAQNRASQRAFRERKEKHVQQLEQQMSSLESKNQHLTESYNCLARAHQKLKREASHLRSELEVLRLKDVSAGEMGMLGLLDQFGSGAVLDAESDVPY